MKLCASLSSVLDMEQISKADITEVRLDILDRVPDNIGKDIIATFRGSPDLSVLPKGFKGMLDIGENALPDTELEVISSHHDFMSTPSAEETERLLESMPGDISKGAFAVNSLSDLKNIYDASKAVKKRHVILGMGDLGTVTRIRQDILGNEFTFAYVGKPTAPGQLSLETMSYLGEHPMITGILGNPLSRTLSPKMHNGVMRKLGIKGIYLKFETESLKHVEDVIRDYDIRGLNVTIPHKSSILSHLDRFDKTVEVIGAANTITNDGGTLAGYNTDVIGIESAMELAGFDPRGRRALIIGSGGAARACAYVLREKGCRVTIVGRNEEKARSVCRDIGGEYAHKDSVPMKMYDLIVNCTPVGMYGSGEYIVNISQLSQDHTVFDMVYGIETVMISRAKDVGAKIISGEDMLAAQGAASLEMWTGKRGLFKQMKEELN